MILLAWCTAAGAIGGVVSFWLMFALVEWLFAKDEPKRKPRHLGPDGYGHGYGERLRCRAK